MILERMRRASAGAALRATMCAFSAALLLAAFLVPDARGMLAGLVRIVSAPAQLTRDYFKPELGGVSGALLNAALVGAICCALTFLPEAKVSGATVLGFFLTTGYGAYGINLLNMLPFVLGVFVYSRLRRQPFGRFINLAMFSTGLAPLASEALFRYPGAQVHGAAFPGALLALGIGIVVGCAMPALCAHSPAFHKGFDLYNAGPAAGFLCFLIYAVLYRTLGVEPPAAAAELGEGHRLFVNVFCAAWFGSCLAFGLLLNGGIGDFRGLLMDPGYRTDFTEKYAPGSCLMNLGAYGLFILLYYNLIGARFTGVTMGAVFCMAACACAGATPLNVLPIMIGYILASRFGASAVNAQAIVVGLCYASGLAPVSGVYGPVAGIVAGMLHYCLVTSVPATHGGLNLYNGGFTAGIVCFVLVPLLEHWLPRGRGRDNSEGRVG